MQLLQLMNLLLSRSMCLVKSDFELCLVDIIRHCILILQPLRCIRNVCSINAVLAIIFNTALS